MLYLSWLPIQSTKIIIVHICTPKLTLLEPVTRNLRLNLRSPFDPSQRLICTCNYLHELGEYFLSVRPQTTWGPWLCQKVKLSTYHSPRTLQRNCVDKVKGQNCYGVFTGSGVNINFSKQSVIYENMPFQSNSWENNQFLQLCSLSKKNDSYWTYANNYIVMNFSIFTNNFCVLEKLGREREICLKVCWQEYTLLSCWRL